MNVFDLVNSKDIRLVRTKNVDQHYILIDEMYHQNLLPICSKEKNNIRIKKSKVTDKYLSKKHFSVSNKLKTNSINLNCNFQSEVLLYLSHSLKPFTIKSLSCELNISEISLCNVISSLIDKRIVCKKTYYDCDIYWLNIDHLLLPYASDVDITQQHLFMIQQEILSYSRQERNINQQYRTLQHKTIEICKMMKNIKDKEKCLFKLSETVNIMSNSHKNNMILCGELKNIKYKKTLDETNFDIKQTLQLISSLTNHWKFRKQVCMDFIQLASDAMEKKKSVVMRIMNCESDENVGVTISKIPSKNITDNN